MDTITQFLDRTFFGISLLQFSISFLIVIAGIFARFINRILLTRTASLMEKNDKKVAAIIIGAIVTPLGIILVFGGTWGAVSILPLPSDPYDIYRLVHALFRSSMILLAIWLGVAVTNSLFKELMVRALETQTPLDEQLLPLIRSSIQIFLIVIGGVTVLQELGYSVSSLIAGLGLGGAAFALASRDTLSNLFGSLVIFIDRPFMVGDWIEIGDIEGTVEEVGLRVTRIRTFANSLITLPNSMLTTQPINNWSRMKKRRIRMTIGLTYDSSPDQVDKAVEAIRKVIREDERMHQDFFLVNFKGFGAYSLDIFVYCFTVTTQWAEHLQVQQELLLKFMREIEALGLSFAFPTQSIHVESYGNEPDAMNKELPS